jgi:antitoxin (DNA-binding transcriptional repressor) of toxin-antitoxin stability system
LSEHLQRVDEGETIIVTDRGRPVARLVPYDTSSAVKRGIAEGWIEPARRTGLGKAERHRSTQSVVEALDADRS